MSSSEQNLSNPAANAARKLRFGSFEVDFEERELRNRGLRVRLQHKPFHILELLLQQPGSLVTREQLARHLWPNLHVSFDRSLNTAVNSLRQALGDSPRRCRYIETRSGLGYRFVGHVEPIEEIKSRSPAGETTNHTAKFEAYQDYLKGRYFYNKMTEDDLRKSIALFEAALAQDPRYALAYTGLADTYCLLAFFGILDSADAHQRAIPLVTTALEIDDECAEAHASLAGIKKSFQWDWPGAEAEYRRALQLKPDYADAHRWYAALLSAIGRPGQAMKEIRCAQELDPLSLVISMELAWDLYMARDFQGAVDQSWRTLGLEPRFAAAQHTLGLAYEQLGMHEEALIEFRNARVCSGDHPVTIAALGHAYGKAGRHADASDILREFDDMSARRHVSSYWRSIVYTGMGAHRMAFESLETAFEQRDVWLVWLKVEPRFDPLRGDPHFKALLRRLRLNIGTWELAHANSA